MKQPDGPPNRNPESWTPDFQVLKMMLPLFSPQQQQTFDCILKMMEMQKYLELYREKAARAGETDGNGWRREMLYSIRPHMAPDKQDKIDLLIHCIDSKEIMDRMKGI